jgi:KaiC/GvpD/RAD55 family RecA-like ATPase
VVTADELLVRPYAAPEFLVQGLIPRRGTVLISADTGAGKSALLIHAALALTAGRVVAGRFEVAPDTRPVLYVNGEMGPSTLAPYVHQAKAGLRMDSCAGLIFEGTDGLAVFRFNGSPELRDRLLATIEQLRPSLVIFDTLRALFEVDEKDELEARRVCSWLSCIAERYDCATVLSHHQRKLGAISNSGRERAAGSRDWIAAVDVHIELKARSGQALHAIRLDKTRFPIEGAMPGTEWAVEARLDMSTSPPRSTFLAGEPMANGQGGAGSVDDAAEEIRARLEAEGPLDRERLGAKTGTLRRAWEKLKSAGELVEVGREGRRPIYGLTGIHDDKERSC